MAVADSIAAIELNCHADFSVLAFQPDIAQNRALAFRRESFASNLRMQIAENCRSAALLRDAAVDSQAQRSPDKLTEGNAEPGPYRTRTALSENAWPYLCWATGA